MKMKKHTEEFKQACRERQTGRKYSDEAKRNMSESKKRNWQDPEYRKRMSEKHLGQKAWNKGLKIKLNNALDEWRKNGGASWNKGKSHKWGNHTPETRAKLSIIAKQRIQNGTHNFIDLKITDENKKERRSSKFLIWRKFVFGRDNYTCQKCGKRGGKLHPHHIMNFAKHKELRYDPENGITLCKNCHFDFHLIYGTKNNNLNQLTEFMQNFDVVRKVCKIQYELELKFD